MEIENAIMEMEITEYILVIFFFKPTVADPDTCFSVERQKLWSLVWGSCFFTEGTDFYKVINV